MCVVQLLAPMAEGLFAKIYSYQGKHLAKAISLLAARISVLRMNRER